MSHSYSSHINFITFTNFIVAIPLSLHTLTLLKWKSEQGQEGKFYLSKKVCSKWKTFGHQFERGEKDLDDLEAKCHGNALQAWKEVMGQWVENNGTPKYPATWRGLIALLEDSECSEEAKELERVLASVIPPPKPSPPVSVDTPTAVSSTSAEQTVASSALASACKDAVR